MNIRVLVVGNSEENIQPEAEMLKNRGFVAYTGHESTVEEMIEEVKPHVVYFNAANPDSKTTRVYHTLLKKMRINHIPVVYTLAEDDAYIVNKTVSRQKKSYILDNIVDSIKIALLDESLLLNKLIKKVSRATTLDMPSYAQIA